MKQMMIIFFFIAYLISTFISLATECGEKKLLNETCFMILREQQLIIPHPGSFSRVCTTQVHATRADVHPCSRM